MNANQKAKGNVKIWEVVIQNTFAILVVGVAALLVALIAIGAFFGVDLSDEGMYLISFRHPEHTNPTRQYQYIIHGLFDWLSPSIAFYRILRLSLTVVVAVGAAKAFILISPSNWQLNCKKAITFLSAYITIGMMLSYSIFPQTFSYNSFTLILLMATPCLLVFSYFVSKQWLSILCAFGVGTCLTLQLFTKFTSLPLLVFALFLLIFLCRQTTETSHRKELWRYVAVLLGGIVPILFYSLMVQSPVDWMASIQTIASISSDHQMSTLIDEYREDQRETYSYLFSTYGILYLFLFGSTLILKKYRPEVLNLILMVSIPAAIIIPFYFEQWNKQGNHLPPHMYQAVQLYIHALLCVIVSMVPLIIKRANLIPGLLIFLCLFPLTFAGSAGTNNPLSLHIIQFAVFWWIIIAIIVYSYFKQNKWAHVLLGVIALLGAIQIQSGFLHHPYRSSETMLEQFRHSVKSDVIPALWLDQKTESYLQFISNTLIEHDISEGSAMLALDREPGLVYAMKGVSPGVSFFKLESPEKMLHLLSSTPLTQQTKALFHSEAILPNFIDQVLQTEQFELVDSVTHYRKDRNTYIFIREEIGE